MILYIKYLSKNVIQKREFILSEKIDRTWLSKANYQTIFDKYIQKDFINLSLIDLKN